MAIGGLREQLFLSAEIEAERTLSILRIVTSLALATTLTMALVTAPEAPPLAVRNQLTVAFVVLAVYVTIGAGAYQLSRPGRFRAWMPWLFTVADCGLILFNIALTTHNIGAPASTLWLYPSTWLAPLVLAFGTLRYRPVLQAFPVALLGGGILVMLWTAAPGPTDLDRLAPLLGGPPSTVRVAALALLGVVLVLAASRRRALLERAIREAVERANLARYLPPEIAALLATGDVARLRRGWDVEIGLLIVDIRGFTRRSERLAPPEISAFLGHFRHQVIEAAGAHQGVVDKFVGDSAILVFGVPEGRGDDAARTLDCARHLLRRIERWNSHLAAQGEEPVQVGIGAHFGPAFAGAVGDESRLEFTVLGDTVNVASRLEQLTRELGGGLLASRRLVEQAGESTGWQPLPTRAVRGREQPLEILYWQGANRP